MGSKDAADEGEIEVAEGGSMEAADEVEMKAAESEE